MKSMESEQLSIYLEIQNITILSIQTLLFSFMLIKLRGKVDFSGIVTISIHLIVSVLRLNKFQDYQPIFSALLVAANNLIIGSLYYFIFEMNKIKGVLTS